MKPIRVTIHMVSSLDGMIAKPDNSVAWFETQSDFEGGADIATLMQSMKEVDCYVMGANTYEHAVELSAAYGWPYGDTPTYVTTHRSHPRFRPNIRYHSGDLHQLLQTLEQSGFRNIWVVGGPTLVHDFLRLGLADEIRMPVIPILLGEGISFFQSGGIEQKLMLKDVKGFRNGLVELHYEIEKGKDT
jgi:dihydrofolate reductase